MKYAEAWEQLKAVLEQERDIGGDRNELSWTTHTAKRYLVLMNKLEEEYE